MASREERLLNITEHIMSQAVEGGIIRLQTEDETLEGATMTVNGSKLIDFGSCSYLGLNRDDRLKSAALDVVNRYGPNYSSSTVYTSLGLYGELEDRLERMFDAPALAAPTTTLAHLGALPVLALPGDLAILDQNAHATLHLTADVLRGKGVHVETTPHNDPEALAKRVAVASRKFNKVWYVADGLYSMFGDFAPVEDIAPLLDEFPNFHVYYDEAHSIGWLGKHGRGHVLSQVPWHPRMVIAAGLAKSFGAHGAVLAFGSEELKRRVLLTGPTFTFSGPIQVASLGAAIASADIHLSPDLPVLQRRFREQMTLVRSLLHEANLPLVGEEQSPIWFIKIGQADPAIEIVRTMMDAGFYVNPASYPAVPLGSAGIRFTNTLLHSERNLRDLVGELTRLVKKPEPDLVIDLRTPKPSPQPVDVQ